eukprot:366260-Chlamydomonas_euryale.AAC.35
MRRRLLKLLKSCSIDGRVLASMSWPQICRRRGRGASFSSMSAPSCPGGKLWLTSSLPELGAAVCADSFELTAHAEATETLAAHAESPETLVGGEAVARLPFGLTASCSWMTVRPREQISLVSTSVCDNCAVASDNGVHASVVAGIGVAGSARARSPAVPALLLVGSLVGGVASEAGVERSKGIGRLLVQGAFAPRPGFAAGLSSAS